MSIHLPTVPEALASLLRTIIVALFLLTFLLQPFLIPSESMERTLLVGDFLLVNRQIFAPAGRFGRWILPYRNVERGDVVIFHHPDPAYLVKRVIGLPGDSVRIVNGKVSVNGVPLVEPYAVYELAPPNHFRDNFPGGIYSDPSVDPVWWRQLQDLTRDGALVVPAGEYFVMGDNRNHSEDSRYWGLVPRDAIVARPLVIYFSLRRKSSTDVQEGANDRLGHDSGFSAHLAGLARWKRIFTVVR
ncbi:MAG TPA: signal peptidase I [Terracidiphilus sp.]|nr:signal peptidase I [Terracidiphilus sp.]